MARSSRSTFNRIALSLLTLLLFPGCQRGPELLPVHGTVTLDGQPIENASVMFVAVAGGRPAAGITDSAGRYALTTYKPNDGCAPGKHTVCITLNQIEGSGGTMTPEGAVSGSGLIKTTWIVPERYSDLRNSGLTADVRRKQQTYDFALQSEE
ncbi:MAG TPA: carboxypeptidase-like regulatory domain-containing protein [Pirellulaceae bacterium]|nr:carboxypeptidase-like regulatory domain-containing protein [Pirellulaceae bacterium]